MERDFDTTDGNGFQLCSLYILSCQLASHTPRRYTLSTHLGPPLLELRLVEISKLVDLRRLASNHALGELGESTNGSASADGVLRCLGRHLDNNDSWVVWATVVLSVTEVSNPRLERGAVVLMHLLTVGDDGSGAGDRGPLAGRGEEGDVDVGVVLEVVGLAGLGVGVEDEVDAVTLL